MDMLNITGLLFTKAIWGTVIDAFVSFTANYGWAIILFIIALKVVMSPLDFVNRKVTMNNSRVQALAKPDMDAVIQKYPNDKNKQSELQMQIYKKYGYNVVGSCVTMIITMAISLIIFFTLFSSLNAITIDKMKEEYIGLKTVYEQTYDSDDTRNTAVLEKYTELQEKNSWLWIKNVWRSDTHVPAMYSFEEYASKAKLNKEAIETEKPIYNAVREIIYSQQSNTGWNGFYVLVLLAGLSSFFAQWISSKSTKSSSAPNAAASTNKMMLILLPVMMVVFAFSSSVIFTLYLIINSLMTALISWISMKISKKGGKSPKKKDAIEVVEYSRNYFKG